MGYKINLACGTDVRDGWVNFDIVRQWPQSSKPCDVIWDARKDRINLPNDSVDEVYAGYLLLHLAPNHHNRVLRDIRRVMCSGASLRVSEVDMEKVFKRWIQNPFDTHTNSMIWGEQGFDYDGTEIQGEFADFDKHCQGFSEESLKVLLQRNGFTGIKRISIHPSVYYELTLDCVKES